LLTRYFLFYFSANSSGLPVRQASSGWQSICFC
jgi:hypothetical protein